jgi:hypothetical protein
MGSFVPPRRLNYLLKCSLFWPYSCNQYTESSLWRVSVSKKTMLVKTDLPEQDVSVRYSTPSFYNVCSTGRVSVRYSTVRRPNRPGRRRLASKIRVFPKVFKDEGGEVTRPLRRQFHRRISRGQPLLGQKLLKLARLPAIGKFIENISQIRIRI